MLIQFITKNFKMFRDDIIFDMSATDEQTEGYHMRSSAGERVLPIAAIFGANAAGKTTFVQSFAAMKHFVKNSLTAKPGKRIFPTFLTSTDPTEFEIYFSIDDVVFNYGFAATNVIVEEWMNYKRSGDTDPSPVFYRSTDELDISGLPPYCHRNIQKYIKSNILILTLGNALGVQVCKTVAEWFDNAQVISTTLPAQEYIGDKEKALQFIQHFEPQIVDLKIDSQTSGPARIHTIRKGPDGKCYSFPIQSESAGIRKLLALYPAIRHAFDTGSLLVIDDLDAHLHPLVVRHLAQMFLDEGVTQKGVQLVFTAHDTSLLFLPLFRKDAIWLLEKGTDGASELYSIAEFKEEMGKNVNLQKDYLLGRFGGIPTLF